MSMTYDQFEKQAIVLKENPTVIVFTLPEPAPEPEVRELPVVRLDIPEPVPAWNTPAHVAGGFGFDSSASSLVDLSGSGAQGAGASSSAAALWHPADSAADKATMGFLPSLSAASTTSMVRSSKRKKTLEFTGRGDRLGLASAKAEAKTTKKKAERAQSQAVQVCFA